MKKAITFSRKSLAVFLSMLMIMTAWVFVAPQKAEAANHSLSVSVSISGDDSIDQVNTTVSWGNAEGHTSGSGSVGGRSGGSISGCSGPPTSFTISGRQIERANATTQRKATVSVTVYWDGKNVGSGSWTWDSGTDGNYTQDTYRYPSNSANCSASITLTNSTTNLKSAATCTAGPVYYKTCSVCGAKSSQTWTGAALGHNFTSQTVNNTYLKSAATCTAKAVYYYKCSRCSEKGTATYEYGNPLGHDFSSQTKTDTYLKSAVTCTTPATYYYKCSRCSEKGTATYTSGNALGHDFTSKTETTTYLKSAATCTSPAIYYYKCSRCDVKGTETYTSGSAKGHNFAGAYQHVETGKHNRKCTRCNEYGINGVVGATEDCTPAGTWSFDANQHWKVCTLCNGLATAKEDHAGGTATCSASAVCETCSASYGTVDPDNHTWGEPTYEWSDDGHTCTATRICTGDSSHVESEQVTLGNGITSSLKTPATCSEKGWTTYTATFTNTGFGSDTKDVQDVEIDPDAHDWDYGNATFNWDGFECKTATVPCVNDAEHTKTVDTEVDYVIFPEPTCEGEGTKTYTAKFTVDGNDYTDSKAEVLDPLQHVWVETVDEAHLASAADCEHSAVYHKWCSRCGVDHPTDTFENGDPLGHNYAGDPNNLGNGSHNFACLNGCGTFGTIENGEQVKNGSVSCDATYSDWSEDTATCTATGTHYRDCSVCGYRQTETTPALGHDWSEVSYDWEKVGADWYCTAARTCGNDHAHDQSERVKAESALKEEATCLVDGWTTYTATFANEAFAAVSKDEQDILAIGHDWSEPVYTWAKQDDGSWTCTAERQCANDHAHDESETITATPAIMTDETGALEDWTRFTADFENEAFDTQTKDEYNIIYDLAGGELAEGESNPDKFTEDSSDITLVNPTKTGYDFVGWAGTGLSEPTTTVSIPTGSVNSRTYTAMWRAIVYPITYTLNGGSVEGENPESYTIESADIAIINPTRTGYTFDGWTGTDLEEASKAVTIASGSTGARSFTANWTLNEYELTYDLAGGELAEGESNPAKYTVEDDEITLVNPTRTGYTFTGWTGTGLDEAAMTVVIPAGSVGDRSYTATWDAVVYDISYELNGGEAENPATYTIESEDIALDNPTKTAYDFVGWSGTDLEGTENTEVTILKGSYGDRSYTANWTPTIYDIVYDLDQGTVDGENPVKYHVETDTFTLINPTRTGYTFTGWTGSNGEQPQLEATVEKGTYGHLNFKANWSLDTYTVSYDYAGGEAENPASYNYEDETIVLNNPVRTAYDFTGWTGSNGTEPQLEAKIEHNSTGDKTFTANWTPHVYSISYDLAGGAVEGENPIEYNVESETFTLINPTRTGYIFDGWTGSNGDDPETEVVISEGSYGELSYTANWTAIVYDLSYELNGATTEPANPSTYTIESDDITLINPEKTAYDFAGWTGTDVDEPSKSVTIAKGSYGDREFEANWDAHVYAISYDLGGGEFKTEYKTTYTVEDDTFTLAIPERTGYAFVGWTGSNGDEKQVAVTVENGTYGELSYTAHWESVPYSIAYDYDGGDAINPQGYDIESEDITLSNPTKRGYTFIGWSGTELEGDNNMEVVIPTGSIGDRSYTAHWDVNVYDITYDLDGGEVEGNPANYTVETETFTLINPTKTGYTFIGWTGSNGDEPSTEVTIEKGTIDALSFTANWAINPSTLKVDPNGGSWEGSADVQSFTQDYNTTKEIADPTAQNVDLHFVEWTLNEGANGSFEDGVYTYGPAKDSEDTLIAKYEDHTYGEVTYTWDGTTSCHAERTCSFCGYVQSETTTNITDKVKDDPTCTGMGTTTYTAHFDNPAFATSKDVVDIDPTGHSPSSLITYENVVPATCTEKGSYDRVVYCTVCGAELERVPMETYPAGHKSTIVPGTPATCSEDGVTGFSVCTVCGETLSDPVVIPATGKHVDNNIDGHCDNCGAVVGESARPDACNLCGNVHSGFWGAIVQFFHNIIYFIRGILW